ARRLRHPRLPVPTRPPASALLDRPRRPQPYARSFPPSDRHGNRRDQHTTLFTPLLDITEYSSLHPCSSSALSLTAEGSPAIRRRYRRLYTPLDLLPDRSHEYPSKTQTVDSIRRLFTCSKKSAQ